MSTPTVEIRDLTNDEYHALPSWSSSQLKLLPKEPELFYRQYIEKHPAFQFTPTTSTKLGTAVHSRILDGTPTKLIPQSVLQRRESKDGKITYAKAGDAWKDFRAEWGDTHVLCKFDDPILHMVDSIRAEPMAAKWLAADGPTELSLLYDDPVTGLPLRARLDKIAATEHGGSVITDLKTTRANPDSPREMGIEIAKYAYHKQAAWYWDAVDLAAPSELIPGCGYVEASQLIFAQSIPPYKCRVIELWPEDIELGRRENRRALDDLHRRLDSNDWKPETYGKVTYVELPDWYRKLEDENYG